MNFNQVVLVGNIGKDPETKCLPSGDQVANFSIAVTKKWGKGDEKKERTSWFDIVCFSHTAKFAGTYLKKGQSVLISGELQQDSWEQEGQKRYAVKVIARDVQALVRRDSGEYPDFGGGPVPF